MKPLAANSVTATLLAPLSDNAGTTIKILAELVDENGISQKMIEVAIPEDATEEMESESFR